MIRFRILMMVPALLLAASSTLRAQDDQDEEVAEEAAQEVDLAAERAAAIEATMAWLELVDAGDYDESWTEAAALFQEAVTLETWIQAVGDARTPFEPFGERTQLGAQYTTEVPNAPPGEYVIVQFRTHVSGDRTVIETVAPMKQEGEWRVSGYFVRPE